MPNWKKVIVSGSDAALNSLYVTGAVTASAISASYIDLDPLANGDIPAHKEGRIFFGQEDGALEVYNNEADITLQVGQEFWVRSKNNSGGDILNGTPVRISGSQGDRVAIFPALAEDATNPNHDPFENHVIGVATHDILDTEEGYVTVQGIVRGVDTSGFNAGDILYLQTGSVGFRNSPPPFPYETVIVGIATKINGSNGFIFVEPREPVELERITGISGSVYSSPIGSLLVKTLDGGLSYSKTLSGSYTFEAAQLDIQGGVTASSYTGSYYGDGSGITGIISSSYAVTASHALNAGGSTALAFSYFNVQNSSLADNATYRLGQMTTLQTSVNAVAHIPLPSGTITEAYIGVYNASTFASGENITVNFLSDGGATSNTLSSTVTATSRHQEFIITGLSISINAGRTFVNIETPTFTTNPTAVQFRVGIKLEL